MQENRDRFPTTRWSLVGAAVASGTVHGSHEALCTLCGMYWYPLYAFVRRQGQSHEDAQDLTQGFFTRILEKAYLRDFRPERAKFRTFLLTSLKHFMANERDWARAQKRGGASTVIPLDLAFEVAERRYSEDPGHNLTPEKIFEQQWALAVMDRAQLRLKEECVRTGKSRQFDVLRPFVTVEDTSASYNQVAAELEMTEGSVKVAVHRLRRRLREILRNEILQTVTNPQEVDGEIRFLFGALRV